MAVERIVSGRARRIRRTCAPLFFEYGPVVQSTAGVRMARMTVIDRDGNQHEIEAATGVSVMEVLRDGGDFGVAAICGGLCSCATCHVYIDDEYFKKLKSRHNDEQEILVALTSFKPNNSRLSCQVPFVPELDGMKVAVAPED